MTPGQIWNFARTFLRNRRQAYLRVFNPESIDAQIVLSDLAQFCRADRSTVDAVTLKAPERLTWVYEGRRQVFLRLMQHTNLTEDQLWQLYDGRPEPDER